MSQQIGELADRLIKGYRTSIEELGLSVRALNVLWRRRVEYVEHLIQFDLDELKRFRCMGEKTFAEIKEKVKLFGINCWE